MKIFLRLLKKKLHELNFTQIQKSKCRGKLKWQTNEKEEKFVLKMYLIKQKPCNLLPKLEESCKMWEIESTK